jgi:hypothetical protein
MAWQEGQTTEDGPAWNWPAAPRPRPGSRDALALASDRRNRGSGRGPRPAAPTGNATAVRLLAGLHPAPPPRSGLRWHEGCGVPNGIRRQDPARTIVATCRPNAQRQRLTAGLRRREPTGVDGFRRWFGDNSGTAAANGGMAENQRGCGVSPLRRIAATTDPSCTRRHPRPAVACARATSRSDDPSTALETWMTAPGSQCRHSAYGSTQDSDSHGRDSAAAGEAREVGARR